MSEKYRLIILPEAQQDIHSIILYIARDLFSPQAALDLQAEFYEKIKTLAYMPERIRTIDDEQWGSEGIRKIRVKKYYIYFLIDEDEMAVKIIAVIYTGRDQKKQLLKRSDKE